MKPYKDTFLNRNTRIRRFKHSVSSEELVWHRDRSDRVVKIVEGSGWQLQIDNGLPKKLVAGKEYHIPANNYHRLIKGKTDLVAEIKEDKVKITRRQLGSIIRESIRHQDRMVIEEGVFLDAMSWMKEKGKGAVVSTKDFLEKFKVEMNETKQGTEILRAIASGQEISAEDLKFVKDQVADIAKGSAMLGLFILPGGGLAAAALVKMAKKVGINLMPSAFSGNKNET